MALWAALSLIVIMVSCFGDSIKPWLYCLFPFSLVVSPLSNFADVYNVGNIPLSFFLKNKNKKDLHRYEISSWNGTITVLFISFLLHFLSLSLLWYNNALLSATLNLSPTGKTYRMLLLGCNNSAHEHFTKRKIMYNTAILLAILPGEWTFQEKHIQHCYILGHNNGTYKHFTKRKIMYNTAILLVILLTRRMNFSIHDDAIYSQWRLHHFILLAYKTILANLERRWQTMTRSV